MVFSAEKYKRPAFFIWECPPLREKELQSNPEQKPNTLPKTQYGISLR